MSKIVPFVHTMKVEKTPILIQKGTKFMCLLYSILFGENCGCGTWNRRGCGQRRCAAESYVNCGCTRAESREDSCGASANLNTNTVQGNNGCCRNLCCSGFGRHGNDSVCCDEEYYCRQYALCRCCGCCARRSSGCQCSNFFSEG